MLGPPPPHGGGGSKNVFKKKKKMPISIDMFSKQKKMNFIYFKVFPPACNRKSKVIYD